MFNNQNTPFQKRILEFQRICDHKGIFARTPFLSLDEQDELRKASSRYEIMEDGGFENAERKQMILKPFGYTGNCSFSITILKSKYNSSFAKLTHRDVLGAIMALGVEREVVGDILIENDFIAIALSTSIAKYIKEQLLQIGRCGVSFEECNERLTIMQNIKYSEMIISSMRLDRVTAALAHTSRTQAQQLIAMGNVSIGGTPCLDGSKQVECGNRISIRHCGKFVIGEISGMSRKDNFIVRYGKYI